MTVAEAPLLELRPLLPERQPQGAVRGGRLPELLRQRYGGDLAIPIRGERPTVIANFVETLDGAVTFDPHNGKGGGEVSGFFEPDRLVMGILRALADVVLVGAGTLRNDKHGRWTPASIHPSSAAAFVELRTQLGLPAEPGVAVVTASGDLDLDHRGLSDPSVPVLLLTTPTGAGRLARRDLADHVRVQVGAGEQLGGRQVIDALAVAGAQLVLCEGGPHLIGGLLEAGLVDELFLTLAPQIAGRDGANQRLALVEGRAFGVESAPWAELIDVRIAGSHLFNRYRFGRQS